MNGNLLMKGFVPCCGVRIRVHLYQANRTIWGHLRLLCHQQLKLDDNSEGHLLQKYVKLTDGLLLVCGPTGSGKSFTLACCIDYINQTMERHIITLETLSNLSLYLKNL